MLENRPKHALIWNLIRAQYLARESFGNRPRDPVSLTFHSSQDCTLNRLSRQETPPDRKFPVEKGGVLATTSRDAGVVGGDLRINGIADSKPRSRIWDSSRDSPEIRSELSPSLSVHLNQNCALITRTRLLSVPDRKWFQENRGS